MAEIELAFRGAPPVTPTDIVPAEFIYDPERREAAEFLSGKDWRELKVEDLRNHEVALSCFSGTAFAYYLPAYLVAILKDVRAADTLFGSVFYYLRPRSGFLAKLEERKAALSARQKAAVIAFAEYIRQVMPEMFNHDEASQVIQYFQGKA